MSDGATEMLREEAMAKEASRTISEGPAPYRLSSGMSARERLIQTLTNDALNLLHSSKTFEERFQAWHAILELISITSES